MPTQVLHFMFMFPSLPMSSKSLTGLKYYANTTDHHHQANVTKPMQQNQCN